MTNSEERIYNKFLSWLLGCSIRDYEDIHHIDFSTLECKELYDAIMEDKS